MPLRSTCLLTIVVLLGCGGRIDAGLSVPADAQADDVGGDRGARDTAGAHDAEAAIARDSGTRDTSAIETAIDAKDTWTCRGLSEDACRSAAGCTGVPAIRIDVARLCEEPPQILCIRFYATSGALSCAFRIPSAELFLFVDYLHPPDAEYTEWRTCTLAERETVKAAMDVGSCAKLDAGVTD